MAANHVDHYYRKVALDPTAAVDVRVEALQEIQAPSERFLRGLLAAGPPPKLMLIAAQLLEERLVKKGTHVATTKITAAAQKA